jgi:ABC-2 type transport system ATP-binding protein
VTLLQAEKLLDKPVKTLSLANDEDGTGIGVLHRPKIIFFDEPTIGLDIFSQEAMRTLSRTTNPKRNPP